MARMRKYGGSKTTRIMMATVPHVISGLGFRKFQADGFLLTRVSLDIVLFWPEDGFLQPKHVANILKYYQFAGIYIYILCF